MPHRCQLRRTATALAVALALLGAAAPVPASAAPASPPSGGAAPAGGAPPALAVRHVEPADGTTSVRPDTPIRIAFDTAVPNWPHFAAALRHGHFALTVNGQPVPARFDGDAAVLTAHPQLGRYTQYRVELQVGAALRARARGTLPAPALGRVAFTFSTGSALHEPSRVRLQAPESVRVDGVAYLELRATDDYGLPAQGDVSVTLGEGGDRLAGSARAEPAVGRLEATGDGRLTIAVSDREAERVHVAVRVSGPYGDDRDDHELSAEVRFLPGPPASLRLRADTRQLPAGQTASVTGEVADAFGNPVGSQVVVSGTGSTSGALPQVSVQAGDDGRFTAPIRTEAAEYVAVEARVAPAGPAAGLGFPLRFVRQAGGGTELALRAGAATAWGFPEANPPNRVAGPAGTGTGAYVQVLREAAALGGGTVAADGSFAVTTAPFAAGELLTLRFLAAPPTSYRRQEFRLGASDWVTILRELRTGQTQAVLRPSPVLVGRLTAYEGGHPLEWSRRALLRFDLAGIPPGSRLARAVLEGYAGRAAGSVRGGYLTAARAAEPWDRSVTWSTQPARGTEAAVAYTYADHCPVEPVRWDVTPIVRGWLEGQWPNHGLVLHADAPGTPEATPGLLYGIQMYEGSSAACGWWLPLQLRLEVDVPVP